MLPPRCGQQCLAPWLVRSNPACKHALCGQAMSQRGCHPAATHRPQHLLPCTRLQAAVLALLLRDAGRQLGHEALPLRRLRVALPGRQRQQQHGTVGHAAALAQAAPASRQVAPAGGE